MRARPISVEKACFVLSDPPARWQVQHAVSCCEVSGAVQMLMAAVADPAAFMQQIAQGDTRDQLGFLEWSRVGACTCPLVHLSTCPLVSSRPEPLLVLTRLMPPSVSDEKCCSVV